MSEQLEQTILGAALNSDSSAQLVTAKLSPQDFYYPRNEMIFTALADAILKDEPTDAVTIASKIDHDRTGGAPYLFQLIEVACLPAHVEHHIQTLKTTSAKRRLGSAGLAIQQLSEAEDLEQALNEAQAYLDGVIDADSDEAKRVAETIDATLDRFYEIQDGTAPKGLMTGFYDLDEITSGLQPGQMVIVAARPGVGKALALDTPLPTPGGWTTMGEIEAGDWLIGEDGNPTQVVAATGVMTNRKCFEVEFSDGSKIIADAEHLWQTDERKNRRKGEKGSVKTTQQIKDSLRTITKDRRLNHSVRNAKALNLPERDYLVNPYTLGVWLGDGHTRAARMTSADPQVAENINNDGYSCSEAAGVYLYSIKLKSLPELKKRACRWCGGKTERMSCMGCYSTLGTFTARLRTIGVLGDKHIPVEYLRGSERQRRELLAGLMDSDGTVAAGGALQITLTSKRLIDGVYDLIVGLGYRCHMTTKRVKGKSEESSTAYVLTFSTSHKIFKLDRKNKAHRERRKSKNEARSNSRYITAVREVDSVPVRCVQVDNDSHLYLAGESMIPTHNSTIAVDIMRHLSIHEGIPTAIFSLEMSTHEINTRVLASEANVDIKRMRQGRMRSEDWDRVGKARETLDAAPLFIDESPENTVMDIVAKTKMMVKRHGIKLIVVDYLQLLHSGKREESRQQEVAGFSRALKLLAKSAGIPVIAVAQLNRESERNDSKPKPSDLRESGALEQDADVILLLHREDMKHSDGERAGEVDVIVAKNRGGETGTATLVNQLHYGKFGNFKRDFA